LHRGGITTETAFFKIGVFFILFAVFSSLVSYFDIQYLRLSKTVEKVHTLEVERSVAERIIKSYSDGVCLIQGAFYFYDEETNEPLMMMGKRTARD